jgi:uncharacterized membrane protein
MVVHFPIVFLVSTTGFTLLFLLTGNRSFEVTAFNLAFLITGVVSLETSAFYFLGAGVLSLILAMLTGELTRRLNYSQEPVQAFRIEIHFSWILLLLSSTAFLWRCLDPHILRNFRWTSFSYLLIILALPVIVTIISFFGGLLAFPLDKGPGCRMSLVSRKPGPGWHDSFWNFFY